MEKLIHINEEQLDRIFVVEDVFVNDLKGKKAKLKYDKRQGSSRIRNLGNYTSADMLGTAKMDQDNSDTYIVPLKGGINSYNITSIRGVEVMHYFKNYFDRKKTNITLNVNGKKSDYELEMENAEFVEFLRTFAKKVSNVVNYVSGQLKSRDKNFNGFSGVSLYPVPSSSNFNSEMVKELVERGVTIDGLPSVAINETLFKKDLTNLQKDDDFINKNKDYYNGQYYRNSDDKRTHMDVLDDTIRKYNNTTAAQDETLIDNYNQCVRKVIQSYYMHTSPKTIAKNYDKLVQAKNAIRDKLGMSHWKKAFNLIKYAKPASIDKRTKEIQDTVASVMGKTYVSQNPIDIVEISKNNFQIKNLTNDVRMGLKNYFQPTEGIEEELEKIKGTVFVIFDDNISGGATLSDICYQAKKLGIEYIIPITFGEMGAKYSKGNVVVNKPDKWNF